MADKENRIYRFLFCGIVLFLLFFLSVIVVNGKKDSEEKYYCNASIDDEFADDSVLVVLNLEASYRLKEYDENDFPNINCEKVTNLTKEATKVAIEKKTNSLVNLDNYRRTLCIKLKEKSKDNVLKVISELIKRDDVLYAGPDYLISIASTTPHDPDISSQWGIDSIDLENAWDFTIGNSSVIVGVMDSGIDASHPDLSGVVNTSLSIDCTRGEAAPVSTVTDPLGHGTHVAGIIGAIGDNYTGVAGVNWNITLASLRIFDANGYGISSNLEYAIDFAESHSIQILNLSGGWYPGSPYYDLALDTVISTYSGLIVCAAGNSNNDNDGSTPALPASINLDNIISVGAIDIDDLPWFWNAMQGTNFGATTVDIFAPGEYIYSTVPTSLYNTNYEYMSGTSMAAPFVTGVAALLLSIDPYLTTSQIKAAIMNSAKLPNVGGNNPLEDLCVTDGKLDAYGAVKYALENYVTTTTTTLNNSITTITKSQTVLSNNDYFINDNGFYELNVTYSRNYDFSITASYPINVTLYNSNFVPVSYSDLNASSSIVHFIKNLSVGTYYLRVSFTISSQSGTIITQLSKHNHSYGSPYVWLNYNQHRATCACGNTHTEQHVVSAKSLGDGLQYVTCILCGGPANAGIVPGMKGIQVTENGSFISPNGTLVLADEDVDSYLVGEIVFEHEVVEVSRNINIPPYLLKKDEDYFI